jgi:hypothetical protein
MHVRCPALPNTMSHTHAATQVGTHTRHTMPRVWTGLAETTMPRRFATHAQKHGGWFLVVSKRPDRPYSHSSYTTPAPLQGITPCMISPHPLTASQQSKHAGTTRCASMGGRQQTNKPRAGVRARVRVRDSDTPHSDHTHHGPRHTRHTQSCLHPDDRSYSAFDAGNTPLRAARTGRHHDE